MAKMVQLADAERRPNTVLTVGTFDGVHTGHRVLISKVVEKAKIRNGRSVILTFDPHPRDIINPGKSGIRLLSTLQERCAWLSEIGIDEMIVIPFDRDFSLLSSEEFIRQIIWEKIGVSEFVIGYDHQFGKNREGTIDTVQQIGTDLDFDVYVLSRQEVGDQTVSSTAIRSALQNKGDVELAARMLGRPYLLNGTVVHGDGRGKEIGYATANIRSDQSNKVMPKQGVYAVLVKVTGEIHKGMLNIGTRPTFEGKSETIEVHLFNFDRDLYGNSIQVRFMKRIRDEKQFGGSDELKRQLDKDRDASLKSL